MKPKRTRVVIATVALAALAPIGVATNARAAPSCKLPAFGPGKSYRPRIDPTSFSAHVDNPYFPLRPGQTFVYTGTKDGKAALDIVMPTSRTKVIDGVTTRVVEDRLYLNNALEEKTSDYYAQDKCGNVWYFGEDTAELDENRKVLSREGSFHAGVHGAQPGVFMQARPKAGSEFRQEWSPGHAEDRFSAVDLSTPIKVPAGSFNNALRTKEQTDLEPGVLDNKYYVRGIGEVVEVAVHGPLEKLTLVEVVE